MNTTDTSDLAKRLLALRGAAADPATRPGATPRTVAIAGVDYIDDSRSTFLDAALFSILDLGKPLVWIADTAMLPAIDGRLLAFMGEQVDAAVFYGTPDPVKAQALESRSGCVYFADNLRTAVFTARELAVSGGRVLFSPACPATCGLANQAERSAEFRRALNDL